MGMKPPAISNEAMAVLKRYEFPGNVRELKNIIERALIDSGTEMIERRHLHLFPSIPGVASVATPAKPNARTEFVSSLPVNLAEAEELLIQRALQRRTETSPMPPGCWGCIARAFTARSHKGKPVAGN